MKTVILTSQLTNWTRQNPVLQYPFNTALTRNPTTSVDTVLSWTTMLFPWDLSIHQPQSPSLLIASFRYPWRRKEALPWPQHWPKTTAITVLHDSELQPVNMGSQEEMSSTWRVFLTIWLANVLHVQTQVGHHQICKWERAIPAQVNFTSTFLCSTGDC